MLALWFFPDLAALRLARHLVIPSLTGNVNREFAPDELREKSNAVLWQGHSQRLGNAGTHLTDPYDAVITSDHCG